jgi:cobalt-zinc-cadmium efflux system membrane fusion protein
MKSIYKLTLLLLLSFAFTFCGGKKEAISAEEKTHAGEEEGAHEEDENAVEFTPEQFKTAGIVIGKTEMKALSGTIKVNGMLDVPPQNLVSISAPTAGYIKSTDMLQGTYVKKGQTVATLNNPELLNLQQDLVEARGQLQESKSESEFLESDLKRQQELSDEAVNARKTLEKARSEFNAMKGRINSLEGRIGAINARLRAVGINPASVTNANFISTVSIRTPISGYVTEVNTNIGAYVNPTDILFEIVDTKHLHAELTVFEKDVPKLKIGQKVRFTLANETTDRMATVYLIGREISTERTVRIHCHLDKEDAQLLPGMYLQALVETASNKVAALPEKAIVDFQGKKYIFVEAEEEGEAHEGEGEMHHFEMMEVKLGVTEMGYTEVSTSGVDLSTKKVVINGAYDLLSKMKNSEESGGHAH